MYTEATFLGDCKTLFDSINTIKGQPSKNAWCRSSIATYVHDIVSLSSSSNNFNFSYKHINRCLVKDVDVLAKIARHRNLSYTISWRTL